MQNTSPAALSWSSLMGQQFKNRLVSSQNTAFHLKLVHFPQFFLSARIFWKKHG